MAIASKKSKRRKDDKGGRGGGGIKIGISIDAGSSTGGGCVSGTSTPPGIGISIEEKKGKRVKKPKKKEIKRGR